MTLGEKNLEGKRFALLHPKQPVNNCSEHLRKASGQITEEEPHPVRIPRVIPTVDIKERRGKMLDGNFQNRTADKRFPMRTTSQASHLLQILNQDPYRDCHGPLGRSQRPSSKRGGVCVWNNHP